MASITFTNRYGFLTLETTGEFMPVSSIVGAELPDQVKFTLETAEEVALISENKGIQICFEMPLTGKAYVLVHKTQSTAAVAKIKRLRYTASDPACGELERRNREANRGGF